MRAHPQRAQSHGFGRAATCGVFGLSLIAAPLLIAGPSAAQNAPVQLNAPPANQSAHDAALAAAARRDYIAALDLSKKAAAEGQPLDAEQIDFISGKAAQQQAAADEAAKIKANQLAAQGTAQKIMDRQQKDYAERAERAKRAAERTTQCGQQTMAVSDFANAYSAAQGQGIGTMGQGRGTSMGGVGTAVAGSGSLIGSTPSSNC